MTTTQSVVVPREPTEAMLSAAKPWPKHWPKYEDASESARVAFNVDRAVVKSQWRDMLAAAPAPSSLAGGEVQTVPSNVIAACKGEQVRFEAWAKSKRYDMTEHPLHYIFSDPKTDAARMGWNAALAYVREAALSPEAPAREGVKYAVTSEYAVGITEHDPALTPRHEAPFFIKDGEDPAEFRALGKRLADAKHEAPAEGAGEFIEDQFPELNDHLIRMASSGNVGSLTEWSAFWDCLRSALRARSSAPEAIKAAYQRGWNDREDDIIERAERIAPEARDGEAVAWRFRDHPNNGWVYTGLGGGHDGCEVQPLYTHPAAPSADKLRTAVEALEKAPAALEAEARK